MATPDPHQSSDLITFSLSGALQWLWVAIVVPAFGWVWRTESRIGKLTHTVNSNKETASRIEEKVDKIIDHLLDKK